MREWLRKAFGQISGLWTQWKPVQKAIFASVIGVAVLGIVLLVTFSARPSMVPLLSRPVTDDAVLDRIALRLDEERIEYRITGDNLIMVEDQRTAQRARTILVRENLVPSEADPWDLFDVERWTQTDFERNVNLRRSITRQLEQHITALEDIDSASVTLVLPERELFLEDQAPVTASVIVSPRPGSDFRENRAKVEGIERLIQLAVEDLQPENITITDRRGIVLNDFERMQDFDELELTRRELALMRDKEREYREAIIDALRQIYGSDRVKILNIDVDLDLGKRTTETEEHFPITTRPNNPLTPFDDSEFVLSIPRSSEQLSEEYRGTGFNPQGPPGQEGQTPPAYRDLEGLIGEWSSSEDRTNYEINTRRILERGSPSIRRITASVALDGRWERQYTEDGDVIFNPDGSIARDYIPVEDGDLETAEDLVRHAVGFSEERGDSVTVRNVQFDRSDMFAEEDAEYRRRRQIQMIILYSLIGIAAILVIFIAFRLISREIERRRRLKEEELARQHQAMREAALRSAEEEGTEVEMSVEERARLEMQENAINMAREHPEDVAQLIRTWLMEE